MPIDYSEYHPSWKEISRFIRKIRAQDRCEWCGVINYQPHPDTGSKVTLTVAHLDHDKDNNDPANLAALCQRDHLSHDHGQHIENRKYGRKWKKYQLSAFDVQEFVEITKKPLNRKAYGSIPHLPGSNLGPADHHIDPGQARIATERTRDYHDRVIVQEKLDGSCVAVAKLNGNIIPLSRAGYLAISSPWKQHHVFAYWVNKNRDRFDTLLMEGERVIGEWLLLKHGTHYILEHEPFVAFDLMVKDERKPFDEFDARCKEAGFQTPFLINEGKHSLSIDYLQRMPKKYIENKHGRIGPSEGYVWRVERKGKVDFLCKWVRRNYIPGRFFNLKGKEALNDLLKEDQDLVDVYLKIESLFEGK